MKMKQHIVAGCGIAVFAALIAGCGGGSQSSPTPAGVATQSAGSGSTSKQPPNTDAVTVTVRIPARTAPSSRVRIGANAKRAPQYVSPNTTSLSISATGPADSATGTGTCNLGLLTCTGTIYAPPDTNTITVELMAGSNVLAVGTQTGIVLTAGQANAIALTFNGVAANVGFATPPPGALVIGIPSTFTVQLVFLDATSAQIGTPGNVIDGLGNVIVGAGGAPNNITIASNSADVTPTGVATWGGSVSPYTLTQTFSYDGVDIGGSEQVQFTATVNTGAPPPQLADQISVQPMAIFVVANPINPPSGYTVSVPTALPTAGSVTTNTSVVLPLATAVPTTINLLLYANFNTAADATISSDTCSNTYADTGIPVAFPSPSGTAIGSTGTAFSFGAFSTSGNASCAFTLTDATDNVSATTTVNFNNAQVIIDQKGRK